MENLNIPIYRAKKIDSDEYFEFNSYYESNGFYYAIEKVLVKNLNGWFSEVHIPLTQKIDITTLAIHFPDMIDIQGNKIFASLSEDGKGGDIVEQKINMYLDDPRPHNGTYWVKTKCPILYKHMSIYIKYDIKDATPKFADGTITNRHGYKIISNISESEVIGIQK